MPETALRRVRALLSVAVLVAVAGCGAKHSEERSTGSIGGAAWSRDGSSIAWAESVRGVGARIWVGTRDLSDPRPITQPIDALGEIAWLPSHTLLYWANSRLFRLRPGGRSVLITAFAGDGFTLDAGATRIASGGPACSTGCNAGIFMFDLNGSLVRRISKNTESTSPTFSPNGRRIAFARNLCDSTGRCERPVGIWTASLATGRLERLTRTGSCPTWSPDGRNIAYVTYGAVGGYSLRLLPATGGRSTLLLRARDATCPVWAPSSRAVAMVARRGRRPTSELVLVDVRTHRARPLAATTLGEVTSFTWSPDSSRLLVTARPTERACSSLWLIGVHDGKAQVLRRC